MMNLGDSVQLPGCSMRARHLETSTGNSALDSLLGGALGVTGVLVVDETDSRVYSDTLAKYFIAEGLYNGHDVMIAGPEANCVLNGLPTKIEDTSAPNKMPEPGMPPGADGMRIAWRYGATAQVNSSIGQKNRYDLGKPIENLSSFSSTRMLYPEDNRPSSYGELFRILKEQLQKYTKTKAAPGTPAPKKNLLRLVIRQLGSPLWSDPEAVSAFCARLQMLTRSFYVVVMVTTCSPAYSLSLRSELEATSDAYFRLIALTDEEKKAMPGNDKAHGYFQIIRLPRLTSVATTIPPAIDLVFELHRRSFDIKILHLPPALGDEDENKSTKTKGACGIDF